MKQSVMEVNIESSSFQQEQQQQYDAVKITENKKEGFPGTKEEYLIYRDYT